MGIADFLLNGLRDALAAASGQLSGAFIAYVVPLAGAGITLYILVIGIAIARGTVQAPVQELTWRIARMAMIMALLVGTGAYGYVVAGFFEGLRDGLSAAATGNGTPIQAALNETGNQLVEMGNKAAERASHATFFDWELTTIALLYWGAKAILFVLALIPLLLSLAYFYLSLAVGPVFIACLLFPVTAKYFDAWLGTVVVATLTHVAVAVVFGFANSIFARLLQVVAQKESSANPLSLALDTAIAVVILAYAAWKAGDWAAQLAGGSSIYNPLDRGFFTSPVAATARGAAAGAQGAYRAAAWVGKRFQSNEIRRA